MVTWQTTRWRGGDVSGDVAALERSGGADVYVTSSVTWELTSGSKWRQFPVFPALLLAWAGIAEGASNHTGR